MEEPRRGLRRRKVVGDLAVVYANEGLRLCKKPKKFKRNRKKVDVKRNPKKVTLLSFPSKNEKKGPPKKIRRATGNGFVLVTYGEQKKRRKTNPQSREQWRIEKGREGLKAVRVWPCLFPLTRNLFECGDSNTEVSRCCSIIKAASNRS